MALVARPRTTRVRLRRGLSRRYCNTDVYAFLFWLAVQVSQLDRGIALIEQGRPGDAIPLLLQSTETNNGDAVAWKALGVAYATLSQYELAEPALGQACRLAPSLADACYFHGRALYALNRFESSIAALDKAGGSAKVRLGIGQALEALSRFDEAEKAMRQAVALAKGDDPSPSVALGLLLLRTGRAQQAEVVLARAVAAFPGSAEARLNLARTLMDRSAIALAVPHLERAVALAPSSAQAHLLLAKAYIRQGRDKDAQPHFEAAARGAQ